MSEYVQVHATLLTHRKLRRLSRDIGLCPRDTRGLLITLWLNCLTHAEDGNLEDWDAEDIAYYAEWAGDPNELVDALERTAWLDKVDGHYQIHDWADFSGVIQKAQNRAKEREKKREQRKRAAKCPGDKSECPGDVPGTSANVPSEQNRTEQNRTEGNRTEQEASRAREAPPPLPASAALVPAEIQLAPADSVHAGQLPELAKAWGWADPSSAQLQRARVLGPLAPDEVAYARSQMTGKRRPNAGLFLSIIERTRQEAADAAQEVARAPPVHRRVPHQAVELSAPMRAAQRGAALFMEQLRSDARKK